MRRAAIAMLVATAVFTPGAAAATGLSVSPLRLVIAGAGRATITVGNPSSRPVFVEISRAGFARTLRGRPRVRRLQGAADWLRVRPGRLRLAPHAKATIRLTAAPPAGTSPGDHPALILLETREPGERRVRVLLRVGVVVLLRVPGQVVHRLEPQSLRVRRRGSVRLLELRLANRGNVTERLGGARLRLELLQRGKEIRTLRAPRLELLPHSAAIAEFVYRGTLRGLVVARVVLRPAGDGGTRSFRLRL